MSDVLLLEPPTVPDCTRPGDARPHDPHQPVLGAAGLVQRGTELMPVAVRRQLWTMFFDADSIQLPLMVPLEGIPTRPDVLALAGYGDALEAVAREFGAASVAFVLERTGSSATRVSDVSWLDGLRSLADGCSFELRPVLLCTDDGVRVLGEVRPVGSPQPTAPVSVQASSSPVRLADIVRVP